MEENAVLLQTVKSSIEDLGRGFDANYDTQLLYGKGVNGSRVVEIDEEHTRDLMVLENLVIQGVSLDVRCLMETPRRETMGACSFNENHGPELERTNLYFEATGKFLQAASLLEPPSLEKSEYGQGIQSMKIYSDTTNLFEYCAHEYERYKLMVVAASVHKCVGVMYMKVAYFKHSNASKDQHELKKYPRKKAKITLNQPNFMRLLNYMNDLNSAFEATTKCRNAVEAAFAELVNDRDDRLSSVKEVINFNFHNVEGFLRVLRPSMASIRQ